MTDVTVGEKIRGSLAGMSVNSGILSEVRGTESVIFK